MATFNNLSDKLGHIFSKLKNKGQLTELEVKGAMREVRIALLEADVNFSVVKDFIKKVSEKAIGEEVLKSLSPAQQVIKVVNDELVELMGAKHSKLVIADKPPTIIMMCGLQGAGKTTMCGKLANMLKKQGKKPLLVAGDIYRPAAIKQLQVVGKSIDVPVFEAGQIDPVKIVKSAREFALSNSHDIMIVDTAGRLHIDEKLMGELSNIKKVLNPTEILLVVDSMTGQDAVNVAETFNKQLDITGVVLTKLDGDTRGGAALSIRAVTGKPVKFSGIGEKMGDIEPFHPDRMASRILGMGDVLTLIEKAQSVITEEDALLLQKKIKDKSFDLNDYLDQFEKMKSMGSMQDMLSMIPGLSNKIKGANLDMDENKIARMKAIIQSMTAKERINPLLLKSSHRKRIAKGSGTTIQEVNALMKQFDQTKDMMRRMASGGRRGMKMPF